MPTKHVMTHRQQARSRQPVSTQRTAAYERPTNRSALSERFFSWRIRLAAVCPETALMYAVLEDAFLCFHKQFESEPLHRERAREAEHWFFKDDSHWPFSFVSVCGVIGLEPSDIRKKLRRWTPARLDLVRATR